VSRLLQKNTAAIEARQSSLVILGVLFG